MDYITREEFYVHTNEAKEGYERLGKLEAEVLGDADTKRPSLREEFINALDRNRRTMIKIAVGIAIQLAIMFIANYFLTYEFVSTIVKGHP